MKDALLQSIIKSKKTVYFISPHFDDAVLSAGSLMSYLAKHTSVVVINVFTKAGPSPYTLSAKQNLKQTGYTDALKLYADRDKEDKAVLQQITKKIHNLGFVDALWRAKSSSNFFTREFGKLLPEITSVYPTYRFHVISGKIAKQDLELITEIKEKIKEIIIEDNPIVFCPVGIGNHADHVITNKVGRELFPHAIFWSDFPYNETSAKDMVGFDSFVFQENLAEKKKFIEGYQTQYTAMFDDGIALQEEKYYYKKI